MQHKEFHQEPIFKYICYVTLATTLGSFGFIFLKLNLTFSFDNLASYENIDNITKIPKLFASCGFALLAFYALWYRINQTALQIKNQQVQIDELKIQKKSDLLINEINTISQRIQEMTYEIEKPSRYIVEQALELGLRARNLNTGSYLHNHATELTEIKYENGEVDHLEWEGTMKNLHIFLLEFIKNHPNINRENAYNNYDESRKFKHNSIAQQINMLIVVSLKLIETDKKYSSYLRNILSIHYEIAQMLYNVRLLDKTQLSMYCLLQDIERSRNKFDIKLPEIFSKELYEDGLIKDRNEITGVEILSREIDNKLSNVYQITTNSKTFERIDGVHTVKQEIN